MKATIREKSCARSMNWTVIRLSKAGWSRWIVPKRLTQDLASTTRSISGLRNKLGKCSENQAMCGRKIIKAKVREYASMFDVLNVPDLTPNYNVAPTHMVPVVRLKQEERTREMVLLKWGLIPSWAKDPAIGSRMINARADTVAEKPAFRHAFRRRRCLMVADGFYEWQRTNGKKQPYFIGMRDESPFAFAGLWERWGDPFSEAIESCALITTNANDIVRRIHN